MVTQSDYIHRKFDSQHNRPNELYINDAMKRKNRVRPMNGKLPVASHSNTLVTSMTTENSYKPQKHTFTIAKGLEMKQGIDIEKDDRQKVEEWLIDTVGLPQYIHHFMHHGYDELRMIQEIDSKQDLEDIGIIMDYHQSMLLYHIEQMRITTKNGGMNMNFNVRDDDDITPSQEMVDKNEIGYRCGMRMEHHYHTNEYLQESEDSDLDYMDNIVTKGETQW